MLPFKISTKFITIEVYRRGVVFSVASILLTAGVSLCNEKIIIALISIFNDRIFDKSHDNTAIFIGLFLIVISLFLYYLLIINWRKEIYSETFLNIRRAVDSFGSSWRKRIRYASGESLRPMHTEAYEQYLKALDFIRDNQALLDVETYNMSWELLDMIGEEIIQLDDYIKALDEAPSPYISFNPEQSNKEAQEEIEKINNKYKEFVNLIMEKEKYRLK